MTKVLPLNGESTRQRQRAKVRKTGIDPSKQNAGGFYEGMPGVHLTPQGNRKMIQVVVTPEGKCTAELYAHNKLIKLAIEQCCETNPMLAAVFCAAAIDYSIRQKKNWIFRMIYKLRLRKQLRKDVSEKKQAFENFKREKETGKATGIQDPGGHSKSL